MPKRTTRPWFEVRGSGIQGRGVFAVRRIPKGTWIVQYTGELITHEESDRRDAEAAAERHHTFHFILDEAHVIDATAHGSDARYINHSCEPNCEAVFAEEDREIWIVAVRDIRAGEELTYDYGYTVELESWEEARRLYPCHCGAGACRGTILKLA